MLNHQQKYSHKARVVRVFVLRLIGNYLILVSLFFIAKTFYEPLVSELKYYVDSTLLRKEYVVLEKGEEIPIIRLPKPAKSQLASFFNISQIEPMLPIDPGFSIVIPKIAANARIIANVNPADENEYLEKLRYGVAHAAGTYFPGQSGHIFMFAHSTDYIWNVGSYNAIFYLLYKLETNDEINIFYNNKRYVYTVIGKKIVEPTEIQYLTDKSDTEALTLQTCWPPGTTLKRLLVFARPKVE